jgi:hypothetical protein
MKTQIAFVLALFVLVGCASETETRAVHEIANFYGGRVSYSKGVAASTTEGSKKYFELKLSESQYINSVAAEEPASFSALTIYRNLSEEEKDKYTHIKTSVEQQAGDSEKTTEFEYTIQKLKTVEAKLALIKPLQEILKHRHYEQLTQQLDSSAFRNFDMKTFYAQLDTIASACGEINDYHLHAFTFFESEVDQEQKPLLELKGVLVRNKQNVRISVILSTLPEDNRIYGLHFK